MGTDKGFLIIQRELFDHWIWNEKPYSKGQAWIDMIRLANYANKKFRIGTDTVSIPRGSFFTSLKHLSDRWGWSLKKTRLFLTLLENEKMATTKGQSKGTLVTIVNYAKYQSLGQTKGTTKGQTRGKQGASKGQQLNKDNTGKERKFFLTPSASEIKKYFSQNNYHSDPEEFFDYYESRGWKEITDWEAAARRWERKFTGEASTDLDPWDNYEDPYAEFRDAIAKKRQKGQEA